MFPLGCRSSMGMLGRLSFLSSSLTALEKASRFYHFGISHSLSVFPRDTRHILRTLSHRLADIAHFLRIGYMLRFQFLILATYCGLLFGQMLCLLSKTATSCGFSS